VYTDLVDTVEAARGAPPVEDADGRMLAWAAASGSRRASGFVYGDPADGYESPEGGPHPRRNTGVCRLAALVAVAWPTATAEHGKGDDRWSDFEPGLTKVAASPFRTCRRPPHCGRGPGCTAWWRCRSTGDLRTQARQAAKLHRAEMNDLGVRANVR
jgi:hypothetical protein